MFTVIVTTPTASFALSQENIQQSPQRMAETFVLTVTPINNALLEDLRKQPGSPSYPLRWKSRRQQRYVMAMLRERGTIPYQRTGALAAGWMGTVSANTAGGAALVDNPAPALTYVEGENQQPYHADTGWLFAPTVISRYGDMASNAVVETWFTVSDPFAGVPQT